MEKNNEILERSVPALILRYTIPSVVAMLSTALYIVVDGIFIGNYVGADGLAAVNMVMPGFSLVSGIGLMIAVGGGTLISIEIGRGHREEAARRFSMIYTVILVFSAAMTLLTFLFSHRIALFFGADATVVSMVIQYMRWMGLFIFAFVGNYFLDYMLRASSHPRLAMSVLTGAALLNIGLDYLLIARWNLGVQGAALASGVAQVLAFAVLFGILRRFQPLYGLRLVRVRSAILLRALYNGSSEFFTEISYGFTVLLFNWALMARVGVIGVSAYALVSYISVLLAFSVFGFSIALQPLISINFGAGRRDRVRRILRDGYIASFLFVSLATFLLFRNAEWLVSLFLQDDPVLFAMSVQALRIVSLNFLFMCLNVLSSSYFTAVEWAGTSVIISLCRGIGFVALGILVLPQFLGLTGVWVTSPFAEAATLLVTVPLVIRNLRHREFRVGSGRAPKTV